MNRKLALILLLAFILRLYGINWDNGFHLHPDERMLIMVADRIHFFDNLNPQFFNYGTLPIYLLKAVSQIMGLDNYQGMLYVGRSLSIFFDLLTIIFIYKIARLLFSKVYNLKSKIYYLPSFFYAIAFFPIQNSHFFISDVFLTTFTTLLIYLLLVRPLYDRTRDAPNKFRQMIILGCVFAAMTATKFTAIIFYPLILVILFLKIRGSSLITKLLCYFVTLLTFNFSLLTFNFLFMPYAFLDYKKFLADVLLQIKMNNDPYIFPYTLQYVGTIPYLYYLKNIFLWGLGPVISILCLIGFIEVIKKLSNKVIKEKQNKPNYLITNYQLLITILFYLFYFLIIGRSAVKFMRYMLPMYPFLTILASYGLTSLLSFRTPQSGVRNIAKRNSFFTLPEFIPSKVEGVARFLASLGMTGIVIWTLMFISIYSKPHTRITATEWILKNIPAGSTLAIEHWDDRLPLYGTENYKIDELSLYDQPDNNLKWSILNTKLNRSDYIIITSNRLYVPLQKLSDCSKYKLCYPKTADYYKKLFNGSLGFKKVAEFAVYPRLKIGNWKLEIGDEIADESFTVYDHPKILIFKRMSAMPRYPTSEVG